MVDIKKGNHNETETEIETGLAMDAVDIWVNRYIKSEAIC